MSASVVLARLKAAGVKVAVADGKLELEGPRAVLNEDVLGELRAIKAELIKRLSATEPAPASQAEAVIAKWRAAVVQVEPDRPDIERLKSTSLAFLDSPNAVLAIESGWDAVSLFGLHKGQAPKECFDCWGLVVFVAWGVHRPVPEKINERACALRTQRGALQMLPRWRSNLDQAAPWWEHPMTAAKEIAGEQGN